MYTLLLPIIGEVRNADSIVDHLGSLPGREEITVHVVFVQKEVDIIGSDGGRVSFSNDNVDLPAGTTDLIERLRETGLEVQGDVRSGEGIQPVVEAIETENVDQVIVGDRKRSPVGKAIFGSNTLDIIQESGVPVTLVVS